MATVIVAEARKMLGIRREVGNAGIDDAACALGQPGKAGTTGLRPGFEGKPQALFDQVSELAATQGRLRLGSTVEVVWNFDGGFRRRTGKHITTRCPTRRPSWARRLRLGPSSISALSRCVDRSGTR